ncbi:DNA-binding protein YbaB [Herbihabitans rhizosphaerae]|uniref:DNA-binding protein YbaB n=2 Tax=Herbihabitans rhizosphaerae TaxID=1872711 RepID=A0A4Q7KXI6_9PSEU|nr:DNA-binding protein YbaB [Herbihabitans rhizosphaerae]
MQARNAAARDRLDDLLTDVQQRAEQFREAQSEAATTTATVTSPDGLVRATVDANGRLSNLEFAPVAFSKSTPQALARTVQQVVSQGAAEVGRRVSELMSPLQQGVPDLSELFEGAPSLAEFRPPVPTTEPDPGQTPPSHEDEEQNFMTSSMPAPPPPVVEEKPKPKRGRPDDHHDDEPQSWMEGGSSW